MNDEGDEPVEEIPEDISLDEEVIDPLRILEEKIVELEKMNKLRLNFCLKIYIKNMLNVKKIYYI